MFHPLTERFTSPTRAKDAIISPEQPVLSPVSDVRAVVLSALGNATGRAPDALSSEQPLMESGMDSLAVVGFRNEIAASLGITLTETLVFDHPSVDSIVAHLDVSRCELRKAVDPQTHTVVCQIRFRSFLPATPTA